MRANLRTVRPLSWIRDYPVPTLISVSLTVPPSLPYFLSEAISSLICIQPLLPLNSFTTDADSLSVPSPLFLRISRVPLPRHLSVQYTPYVPRVRWVKRGFYCCDKSDIFNGSTNSHNHFISPREV